MIGIQLHKKPIGWVTFMMAWLVGCNAGYSRSSAYPPAIVGLNAGSNHAKLRALLPYFVRQKTDTACSVASTTTILNTVLAQRGHPTLTQAAVLESDTSNHRWAKATADAQAPGVSLDELAWLVMQSFYQQHINRLVVDVVHIDHVNEQALGAWLSVLEQHELLTHPYFLMVNFLQSMCVENRPAVGHISVVGAYDARSSQVLILDVDNDPLEPYWVPVKTLLASKHTIDPQTGQYRGYLVVRLL